MLRKAPSVQFDSEASPKKKENGGCIIGSDSSEAMS